MTRRSCRPVFVLLMVLVPALFHAGARSAGRAAAPGLAVRAETTGEDGVPAPGSRPWPLDIPIHLSSSFGEFRENHLHAGVDVRSFGREGIPCRAVGSGFVSRLRASPFGYGKAVYVKLDSGETAVYAHLSEFSHSADSLVHAAQLADTAYEVDIRVEPGRLPVREGTIIGYTGRTGAAFAHLHFEVRDAGEGPVNPLERGWVLADTIAPTIRRIEWLPLGPESRVDGRCAARVVDLRAIDDHTFAPQETLVVTGRLGIAAQMTDRLDDFSGRLAPYRVDLEIDGERVSRTELKRFDYEQAREVDLTYDISKARTRGQHYLILFRREGETLAGREFVGDGVIDTEAPALRSAGTGRVHTAAVLAADPSGNESVAMVPFVISDAPAGRAPEPGAGRSRAVRSEGRGELPGVYALGGVMSIPERVVVESDSTELVAEPSKASSLAAGGAEELILSFDGVGRAGRTIRLRAHGKVTDVHVFAVPKDVRVVRRFPDLDVTLCADEGSLYSNVLLYVAEWERSAAPMLPARSGLSPVSRAVRLGPMSAAFRQAVELRFVVPRGTEGQRAVFRLDERVGSWSFRESAARGDSVSSYVREPGVYAVLVDSLAPSIGAPVAELRRNHATRSALPEIRVAIADRGSGVDAAKTVVYLDGKKQIARWDGFSEKMFVLLREKNIIGVHDLSIVAVDRLGNTSKLATRIRIPPAAVGRGAEGARHDGP